MNQRVCFTERHRKFP